MKVVEVTTTDNRTRYYLADDAGAPAEPVLQYLRFKDNAGYARNTLRMHCIHLKHYFTFLGEYGRDYEKASVDDLARFIGWLKNPDIGKRIIPLRLEPAHKSKTINANVDTVIAFYEYLLLHEGMENRLSEKLVKFISHPPGNYRSFLNGIAPEKPVKSHMLKLPVPKQVVKTVSKEDAETLLRATTNIRDHFLLYLLFETGMRIGELIALKWEDCKELPHLHVVREEIRNQETNRYDVVEHTKTNRDRYVVLVPKAISILEKIPKQGSYIFMRDGERINARQIAYVLEKYAERRGVATKSTHKMRKTYASNLNANGVPLDCIREMLGHSSLTTTLGYVYNPLTESETYNLISKAL